MDSEFRSPQRLGVSPNPSTDGTSTNYSGGSIEDSTVEYRLDINAFLALKAGAFRSAEEFYMCRQMINDKESQDDILQCIFDLREKQHPEIDPCLPRFSSESEERWGTPRYWAKSQQAFEKGLAIGLAGKVASNAEGANLIAKTRNVLARGLSKAEANG
jgi:hypothetical protein